MKNDLGKTWYYRAGQNIGHPILFVGMQRKGARKIEVNVHVLLRKN